MSRTATEVEHTAYRADIDGLRAVAVLAVIAYHVDASWLPGGFAGVDVFFVISGYLITANLLGALRNRSFGYGRFLAGRVRRLAPALVLVLAATLAAAQWLLRPDDARVVAASALWSLASAANIYFWLYGAHGYFDAASAEQPLLHLWSLGVEEQFYLLWPLLLALAVLPLQRWLGRAAAAAAVLALALGSLLLGNVYTSLSPDFAYYSLPTRAAGLLTGALLALLLAPSGSGHAVAQMDSSPPGRADRRWAALCAPPRAVREIAALAGAILLLGSGSAWIDDETPYPGVAVLWPTLGTALLVYAGSGSGWRTRASNHPHLLAPLLASRPMVAVGRISYAAYLWHWPLLAFYRYGHGAPTPTAGLVLVALTLLLAAASTHLVELPLRQRRAPPLATTLRLLVLPGIALGSVATLLLVTDGFGVRAWLPAHVAAWQRAHVDTRSAEDDPAVCQRLRLDAQDLQSPRCLGGSQAAGAPTVLLWGDSHAAHFVGALTQVGSAVGFRVRNAAHSGCPPLLVDPAGLTQRRDLPDCRASLRAVRDALPAYRDVVIAASWYSYGYRAPDFRQRFEATLRMLNARGIRVTLIGRIPLMPGFDRLCEEKAVTYPGLRCPQPGVRMQAIVATDNAWLRRLATTLPGVHYVDATPQLCPGGTCRAHDRDGTRLYFDANHLSVEGSRRLGLALLRDGVPPALEALARPPTRDLSGASPVPVCGRDESWTIAGSHLGPAPCVAPAARSARAIHAS
jgi:peptidoglycan/LPS O-acetylase OafA/YrhL